MMVRGIGSPSSFSVSPGVCKTQKKGPYPPRSEAEGGPLELSYCEKRERFHGQLERFVMPFLKTELY